MNALAISALVNGITSILSGLFIFFRNVKGSVNKSYFLMAASIAIWSFGYFIWQISLDKPSALFWLRFLSAGAVLIPVAHFYWVLTILDLHSDKGKRRILYIGYILGIFFVIASFTTLIVQDVVPKLSFKYWGVPGLLYPFFLIMFFGFVTYASYLLVTVLRKSTGVRRNQIKLLLILTVIGFLGGATNYPLWYNIPLYPYGNFGVFLYVIILTYAIVRYRVMDINVVFKKTLVYSLSAGILTSLFVVFVLAMTKFLSNIAGITSFTIMVIAALTIAILFNPLKNKIQSLIDKTFYKKSYDYYAIIRKVSHDLVSILDFKKIYRFVGDVIFSTLGLRNIYLLAVVPGGDFVEVYSSLFGKSEGGGKEEQNGEKREETLKINRDSEIVNLLKTNDDIVIKDELPAIAEIIGQETIDNIRDALKPFNGEVIVPVFIDDKLELLLILGEKLSGDIFSDEDIKLLNTISHQTSIAVKNACLYAEKLRTENLASVGMMSATFAHEIRNPLTSIKTFVQLMPEKYNDSDFRETFSKIVIDEIARIDGLIKDLLSFSSKGAIPPSKDLEITALVDDILESLKNKLGLEKKNISVEKIYRNVKINVFGDIKKLRQAIINIITNGCQAMDENGVLKVNIFPNGQDVNVIITDTGKGIPPWDINTIFEPFYTTKHMGVGLGLTISKKIIEDHGGRIAVKSIMLKGTTFTISLPIKNGN